MLAVYRVLSHIYVLHTELKGDIINQLMYCYQILLSESKCINPLTAGAAYIRVFIFY